MNSTKVQSNRPLVLVVAVSARSLVMGLRRAGCDCIALDLFGDLDTVSNALNTYYVGADETLQIDADLVRNSLALIGAQAMRSGRRIDALVYGSGLEATPELLDDFSRCAPLAGNSRGVLEKITSPRRFFALLAQLGLPHPPILFDQQLAPDARGLGSDTCWLVKPAGGSGGLHIRSHQLGETCSAKEYLQRELPPVAPQDGSFSVTYLAGPREVRLLGINRQWQGCADAPYVYRGAISQWNLSPDLQRQVYEQAAVLLRALAVRGLGSVDFLIHDANLYWLEVNARPSASFELYEPLEPGQGSLMGDHLLTTLAPASVSITDSVPNSAFATNHDGNQVLQKIQPAAAGPRPVRAHWQVYAASDATADEALAKAWQDGAPITDIPKPGTHLAAGAPVCTVHAQAASHELALAQLQTAQALVYRCCPNAAKGSETFSTS